MKKGKLKMTSRELKELIETIIILIVSILVLTSCGKLLSCLDKAEKDKAYSEGRYEEHYTTTGEIYYK
jgi:hypothetical protein